MHYLWQRRVVVFSGCLSVAILLAALGCGSDSTQPNGNQGELIADFAARDSNRTSPTYQQRVQFYPWSTGKACMLYLGDVDCPSCRDQFAGLDSMVTELTDEGFAVTAAMINKPASWYLTFYLDPIGALIPCFQDTVTVVDEQNVPAIAHLLDAPDGDEFLIIDPDHHLARKLRTGPGHELDIARYDDRETVKAWIRELF